MKTAVSSLCLTATILLVACADGDASGEAVSDAASDYTSASDIALAVDGKPAVGKYRAVSEDSGSVLLEDLRDDGTYTFTDEGGTVLEEGTYEQLVPERPCFTANTEGSVQKCYQDLIGEDGVWRTIDPDTGEVSVIERIDP